MFFTYALYSKNYDRIYVGQTNNLEIRLAQHNGESKFKSWTHPYKPWKLFHSEIFETRKEAMKREKQLKSGQGRLFLRQLLDSLAWSSPDKQNENGNESGNERKR